MKERKRKREEIKNRGKGRREEARDIVLESQMMKPF